MRPLIPRVTLLACTLLLSLAASAADPPPEKPIALISAFIPEWKALVQRVSDPVDDRINGVPFVTGSLGGKRVVLMMSGISMVNAAMNAQLLLDHYPVRAIVFSGIAGGADPALKIGDVAVPAEWRQSLETVFARQTRQGFKPEYFDGQPVLPNFGMMFPNRVEVGNQDTPPRYRDWFQADAGLLAVARQVADGVQLYHCATPTRCLAHQPRVVVGGAGVSGPAFVDNKAYRQYVFTIFHARVIDMESAAVAQVAFANQVPFIAFRSLSDLAGGDEKENQMTTFMDLAAANSAIVVSAFIAALP